LKFRKEWNIIPIKLNSKLPLIKWKDYQASQFPRSNFHYYEPCNYAVICGSSSNNLVILDFDFADKPIFENILKDLKVHFTEASDTLIATTPHGLHIYFYIDGEVPDRQTQIKSPFKEIKHMDILGEGGYALISPSQVDGNVYMEVMGDNPKTISEATLNKIINFYTVRDEEEIIAKKKEPSFNLLRIRRPFRDILSGKINIERLASETSQKEFVYWKYTFLECMNAGIIKKPQELYPILRSNQPSFDIAKCEQQIPHHVLPNMRRLSNKKLPLYFPEYDIEDAVSDWLLVAKELLEEYDIITMEDTEQIMIRRGNIYTLDKKDFRNELKTKLEHVTLGKAYKSKKAEILDWIKDGTLFSRDEFCYDDWLINFTNGYYDLRHRTFMPHTENKDKVFFYEIPHEYVKGKASCPKYRQLLLDWLGIDNKVSIDDIFEMIGYSMTMNTDLKMAFFMYGGTHSGKSSFQNILGHIIGDKNIASTDLQRLGRDQFGTDELQFKIVNMIGDMSDSTVQDLSAFKMLTGGDIHIPAEVKGGKKYRFRNTIKIWYNGNYIPKIANEHDEAFYARWILVNFPNYFPLEKDSTIKSVWKVIMEDENEIQGIIHEAIKGAVRLLERGYFRIELIKHAKHVWRYESNDIYAFLYDSCIRGRDESIESIELVDELNRFLHKRRKRPLSAYKISELMADEGIFKIRDGSGERAYYYTGIGWKSSEKETKTFRELN